MTRVPEQDACPRVDRLRRSEAFAWVDPDPLHDAAPPEAAAGDAAMRPPEAAAHDAAIRPTRVRSPTRSGSVDSFARS